MYAMQVSDGIASVLLSVLGMGITWLLGSGGKYVFNNAVKPRMKSRITRAGQHDQAAADSESLVLAAAQLHQQENAELRKEFKESMKELAKVNREIGKLEGRMEQLQPTPPIEPFGIDVLPQPMSDMDNAESGEHTVKEPPNIETKLTGLEILPKSERRKHLLTENAKELDTEWKPKLNL